MTVAALLRANEAALRVKLAEHDMPERFYCRDCDTEISGNMGERCRSCDYEQQAESAADERAGR